MTTEDERRFVDFVRSSGRVQILPESASKDNFRPVQELATPFSGKSWAGYVLFNDSISRNLVTMHIPNVGNYRIDKLRSSVIEFNRSFVKDSKIRPGRIWAQFTFLDSEKKTILPKEQAFEEWYETIATWLRKNYKHLDRQVYVAPGAQRLRDQGMDLLPY